MEDRDAAIAELHTATERLHGTAARLSDQDLRGPSLLPGWSRGHVVAHLARNADSCWNLLEWARTGREIPQYASARHRDDGIALGAGLPATELLRDLRDSAARLDRQARTLPGPAWHATVRAFHGWEHPAWFTVFRRWREVEVHHADLDAGYSHADWPDSYVHWELEETFAWLAEHGGLAAGRVRVTDAGLEVRLGDGPEISGPARELLGWLTGRTDGTNLSITRGAAPPAPPPWPQGPATGRRQA
ncbi:maleylpyruvate isomerase family mycothiol-dependent enzyme [Actinomadura scrupuli]|uniref:maleylpyruvate isomerase family mycothiol-dependent enzyme n=1 Tax=Actinomadura scrupuli TaxID=559629 RepID=UPI003D995011